MEATETQSEPSPHGEFSLKVHPGDSIHPSAAHVLLWRGKVGNDISSMVLHCTEAAQGLALTCQPGLFSIRMKVRASSDSIDSRLVDKTFCLVNKYQQITKKKKKRAGGKLCGTPEETEQDAERSERAEN